MRGNLVRDNEPQVKLKLILRSTDELWERVQKYKDENNIASNNKTVNLLMELGLEQRTIHDNLIEKYANPIKKKKR